MVSDYIDEHNGFLRLSDNEAAFAKTNVMTQISQQQLVFF